MAEEKSAFEEVSNLSDNELIKRAAKEAEEKVENFKLDNLDLVKINREDGKISVVLGYLIRYIPLNSYATYEISVYFSKSVSYLWLSMANPPEFDKDPFSCPPFYSPKNEDEEKVSFVLKTLGKEKGGSDIIAIRERENGYYVTVGMGSTEEKFNIDKSGKISKIEKSVMLEKK